MIQHVENLKRMYAKEHAELEELKQVLLQNERSFNPLGDEGNKVEDNSTSYVFLTFVSYVLSLTNFYNVFNIRPLV